MTASAASFNWRRILVAVIVGYVLSFVLLFCVVTAYASALAFQARGAPDMDQINAFANQIGPWASNLALVLASFAAAAWAVRRVPPGAAMQHGLVVGALLALVSLLISIVLGGFSPWDLLGAVLAAGAGWLGGMAGRARTATTA